MEEGPWANLDEEELSGFFYYVSDEQLDAFARLSPLERLQWVEDARQFTLLGETAETAKWHRIFRKGKWLVDRKWWPEQE